LEEEVQRKAEEEEARRKEKEYQRDLAHYLEVDHVTTIEQQCYKNWSKTFLLPLNFPSNKKMNLIDLPPLTKRQCVCYLPKKTLEVCQQCKELAKEMGVVVVSRESPCERCINFRILYIPQNLP